MLHIILIAWVLVAVTVAVHAAGLAVLLSGWASWHALPPTRFWPITGLLVRVTWWLILIHLVEISAWGLFYFWKGCLPDAESAFYFSGVTYTTIGYGDLVLQEPWRMLGPIEGLTGILMCGLSAGIFFAVVSRIYLSRSRAERQ
jgi:Ion channel